MDWNFRLLDPSLRSFFSALSVFRGGWTLDAAGTVCAEPLALDHLAQLCECSLLETEEMTGVRAEGATAVAEREVHRDPSQNHVSPNRSPFEPPKTTIL